MTQLQRRPLKQIDTVLQKLRHIYSTLIAPNTTNIPETPACLELKRYTWLKNLSIQGLLVSQKFGRKQCLFRPVGVVDLTIALLDLLLNILQLSSHIVDSGEMLFDPVPSDL